MDEPYNNKKKLKGLIAEIHGTRCLETVKVNIMFEEVSENVQNG
jgi:hypothetical protein